MARYQIKVLDGDLADLLHELSMRIRKHLPDVEHEPQEADRLYLDVFQAGKDALHKYVRGFHVCGCAAHCEEDSQPTELRTSKHHRQLFEKLGPDSPLLHPSRIHRYVLALDVPLKEFVKELEVAIYLAARQHPALIRSRRLLFRWINQSVLIVLGKYLYYCPACNRGETLCQLGVCTEFDPWEGVEPRLPVAHSA